MKKSDDDWTIKGWVNMAKSSHHFDSYKVYFIEVFNHEERFIKVGRTFCTLERRFGENESMPYQYRTIHIISDVNPFHICNLENKLKRELKDYRYQPKLSFNGMSESFTTEVLNTEIFLKYVNPPSLNL